MANDDDDKVNPKPGRASPTNPFAARSPSQASNPLPPVKRRSSAESQESYQQPQSQSPRQKDLQQTYIEQLMQLIVHADLAGVARLLHDIDNVSIRQNLPKGYLCQLLVLLSLHESCVDKSLASYLEYRLDTLCDDLNGRLDLVRDDQGLTPLHYACAIMPDAASVNSEQDRLEGTTDIVREQHLAKAVVQLYSKQAGDKMQLLEAVDDRQQTALHKAAVSNNKYTFRNLIALTADLFAQDDQGNSPAHLAVINHSGEVCQLLTDCAPGSVFDRMVNHLGQTPLHCALHEYTNHEVLTTLLGMQMNVNVPDKNGDTAVHYAARYGDLIEYIAKQSEIIQHSQPGTKKVKLPSKAVPNWNARNHHGQTPMHIAVSQRATSNYSKLLALKADVNAADDHRNRPVHYAARANDVDILRSLQSHGAKLHSLNHLEQTPFMVACAAGSVDVIEFILKDAKHAQRYGLSARPEKLRQQLDFSLAQAMNGLVSSVAAGEAIYSHHYLEIIKLLIEHGADPYQMNAQGKMAWQVIVEAGYLDGARALMQQRFNFLARGLRQKNILQTVFESDINVDEKIATLREVFKYLATRGEIKAVFTDNKAFNYQMMLHFVTHPESAMLFNWLQEYLPLFLPEVIEQDLSEHTHGLKLGDAPITRFLLARGVITPSTVIDNQGNSLLHIAAEHNKFNLLCDLKARGADVDATNALGEDCLAVAMRAHHQPPALFKLLLIDRYFPELDVFNDLALVDELTVPDLLQRYMQMTDEKELVDKFVRLMAQGGLNLNEVDVHGRTALSYALATDNMNMQHSLIDAGARAQAGDAQVADQFIVPLDNEGNNALHQICQQFAQRDVTSALEELLLDTTVERLNLGNNDGATPLHLALTANAPTAAIRALLQAGADLNVADRYGVTPLHLLCSRGELGLLVLPEVFTEHLRLNWPQSYEGSTPFDLIPKHQQERFAKLFIMKKYFSEQFDLEFLTRHAEQELQAIADGQDWGELIELIDRHGNTQALTELNQLGLSSLMMPLQDALLRKWLTSDQHSPEEKARHLDVMLSSNAEVTSAPADETSLLSLAIQDRNLDAVRIMRQRTQPLQLHPHEIGTSFDILKLVHLRNYVDLEIAVLAGLSDVNQVGPFGASPLQIAIEMQDARMVEILLKSPEIDLYKLNENAESAVYLMKTSSNAQIRALCPPVDVEHPLQVAVQNYCQQPSVERLRLMLRVMQKNSGLMRDNEEMREKLLMTAANTTNDLVILLMLQDKYFSADVLEKYAAYSDAQLQQAIMQTDLAQHLPAIFAEITNQETIADDLDRMQAYFAMRFNPELSDGHTVLYHALLNRAHLLIRRLIGMNYAFNALDKQELDKLDMAPVVFAYEDAGHSLDLPYHPQADEDAMEFWGKNFRRILDYVQQNDHTPSTIQGHLPLIVAAEMGYDELVYKLLIDLVAAGDGDMAGLAREGVLDQRDSEGKTALTAALQRQAYDVIDNPIPVPPSQEEPRESGAGVADSDEEFSPALPRHGRLLAQGMYENQMVDFRRYANFIVKTWTGNTIIPMLKAGADAFTPEAGSLCQNVKDYMSNSYQQSLVDMKFIYSIMESMCYQLKQAPDDERRVLQYQALWATICREMVFSAKPDLQQRDAQFQRNWLQMMALAGMMRDCCMLMHADLHTQATLRRGYAIDFMEQACRIMRAGLSPELLHNPRISVESLLDTHEREGVKNILRSECQQGLAPHACQEMVELCKVMEQRSRFFNRKAGFFPTSPEYSAFKEGEQYFKNDHLLTLRARK